jgi:hypothetical protein
MGKLSVNPRRTADWHEEILLQGRSVKSRAGASVQPETERRQGASIAVDTGVPYPLGRNIFLDI